MESVNSIESDGNLDAQILDLQSKIRSLEDLVDSSNEKEKLLSILNKINLQMSKWSDKLDIEEDYKSCPIRFDIGKLTLSVDTVEKPVALHQIGSGANWVSYHLLILLALHKHFIQNNRPVPRFLILDQPTQVYYPPEKSEGLVEISADELAVKKMFDFVFDTVESLDKNMQVIITDHAYLNDVRFQESIVEVWRDGLKLIPESWPRLAASNNR